MSERRAPPADRRPPSDLRFYVGDLNTAYSRLLSISATVTENGTQDLTEFTTILNGTLPRTETEIAFANSIRYLAGIKRGEFISFVFKARVACLLLIVDGNAIASALKLENILEIRPASDGYRVLFKKEVGYRHGVSTIPTSVRGEDRRSGPSSAPRSASSSAPRSAPRSSDEEGYSTPRRRGKRGGRGRNRGLSSVPTMSIDDCNKVFSGVDASVSDLVVTFLETSPGDESPTNEPPAESQPAESQPAESLPAASEPLPAASEPQPAEPQPTASEPQPTASEPLPAASEPLPAGSEPLPAEPPAEQLASAEPLPATAAPAPETKPTLQAASTGSKLPWTSATQTIAAVVLPPAPAEKPPTRAVPLKKKKSPIPTVVPPMSNWADGAESD